MSNTLYYGDNLEVFRKYIKDETIDLCYIDPPFNSKRNYNQIYNNIGTEDRAQAQAFVDTWVWDDESIAGFAEIISNAGNRFTAHTIELIKGLHAVLGQGSLLAYLVSMTLRIVEIQRVLKPTGSFYLHCDPTASHYLKLVCDGVFVPDGGEFRNEIVWKRTNVHSDSKTWSRVSDIIFFYTKSDSFTWNPIYSAHSEEHIESKYRNDDGDGRLYTLSDMTSPNPRPNMMYEWKGHSFPPNGWRYSRETMTKLDKENRIWYPDSKLKRPRLKRYLDEMPGTLQGNIWTDIFPLNSQAAERLGYPTQKPEALLERIITASSNEGDSILDAYCGCGTTIAVAQKLNRKWIGMDITYQSIALILKRLEDQYGKEVLNTITLNGIPRDMAAATALANKKDDRVRKEFEKWAILTYTDNRAIINEKKGADGGIDGVAYFMTGAESNEKIVLQVKSGNVQRGDIAKLNGDMTRESAPLAVFVTLKEPSKPMIEEAKSAGTYFMETLARDLDRISIVTIKEILEGAKLNLPMSVEVLKAAKRKVAGDQLGLGV